MPVRVEIEGVGFPSVMAAHRHARLVRGAAVCYPTFWDRFNKGARTWAVLTAPASPKVSEARRAVAARKHEEMAGVIAELDARKRAMKEAEQ